jgi:hypothetical protein
MKSLVLFLVLLLIPVIAASAISEVSVTLQGNGGVIANSDRTWEASSTSLGFVTGGSNYNAGTASSHTLTGPGTSYYEENTKVDHTYDNLIDSNKYLEYDGNGLSWDMYHMTDIRANISPMDCATGVIASAEIENIAEDDETGATAEMIVAGQNPSHQEVTVSSSVSGQASRYEVDVVIDDVNLTSSVRAEGVGNFIETIRTKAMAGFSSETTDLNFQKRERMTFAGFSNKTDPYYGAAVDFRWRDHSNPFDAARTTVTVNETVNATVETLKD